MPKGAKTRALIALLATSDNFERRRVWLQDLLWSDRGPEQRAASLRQALVELRKCWDAEPDMVRADRQVISLNPERLRIDRSGQNKGLIFLEDVKAPDPAFTAWLKLQRMQQSRPATPPQTSDAATTEPSWRTLNVSILCSSDYDANAIAIEQLVLDRLTAMIGECAGVTVRSSRTLVVENNELLCTIKAIVPSGAPPILRVTVESLPGMEMVYAGSAQFPEKFPSAVDAPVALQLCAKVSDAVRGYVPAVDAERSVQSLVGEALAQMFSFEPERVVQAVDLLRQAELVHPSGEVSGWLAQALNIQYVERHVNADAEFLERVQACCRHALSLAPTNSDVLAAVANARVNFDRNYGAGLELARRAIEINNANPLAWWAFSNAQLCIGRTERALNAALKSQYLAQGTRYEFWADFQVAVVSAVLGSVDTAVQMGERSAALAPAFRPPLRYLIALSAMNGDLDNARKQVMRLVAEEADFTVTRMIEDESYPIGIMRRYGRELTESLKKLSGEV